MRILLLRVEVSNIDEKLKRIGQLRLVRVARTMADIYVQNHITRSAAALSYYLTVSIFPLLLCATAILGNIGELHLETVDLLREIIPAAVLEVIVEFMRYVSGNMSVVMIFFGIVVMITTTSAAFRTLMGIMGDIQGGRRFHGMFGHFASFLLSICFPVVVYISGIVIVAGEWLLGHLERVFSLGDITALWLRLRFVLLFTIMFAVIFGVYLLTAPRKSKFSKRLPGALAAAIIIVIVSVIFSHMISESAKYMIVYGSLASIIILMMWIYACALIFIMGNVLNVALTRTVDAT